MSVLFQAHVPDAEPDYKGRTTAYSSRAVLVNCIDAAMQATPPGTIISPHKTLAVPPCCDVNRPAQAQQHVHLLINTIDAHSYHTWSQKGRVLLICYVHLDN